MCHRSRRSPWQRRFFHSNLGVSSELWIEDASNDYALAEQRRNQEPYASRRIRLSVSMDREQIAVCIGDEEPGIDPSQLPDPTAPGFLERPCGRRVLLMRTFMDDVQFNKRGNEVTLIKRRGTPSGDELLTGDE